MKKVSFFSVLAVAVLVSGFFVAGSTRAVGTIININNLQPSYTAPGGGGVWSAYYGPSSGDLTAPYDSISPGSTAVYDEREAGIIKAGLNTAPADDEGLFAVKPTVTINTLAAGDLNYDVETQFGVNPVWMTIEIDTGVLDTRTDNTTYQHVPTTNPAGWHTVDAGAGQWQQWTDYLSGVTTGPLMTLSQVATANTGLNVVRTYLRLGMGESYYNGDTGTTAWVDQVTIGGMTYDFVVAQPTVVYIDPAYTTTSCGGHMCYYDAYPIIQDGITAVANSGTVNVAAGTYPEQILIQKSLTLIGAGVGQTIVKDVSGSPVTRNFASGITGLSSWNSDYLLAAYPEGPSSPISVKVSGFTFDANNQAHQYDRFTGVLFRSVNDATIANAGLFNSSVMGFNPTTDVSATGVRVLGGSNLTIDNNNVSYTVNGIAVYGDIDGGGSLDPKVVVSNNILTFLPHAFTGYEAGIFFAYGASGTINHNTLNNGLSGIILTDLSDSPTTVSNNILSNISSGNVGGCTATLMLTSNCGAIVLDWGASNNIVSNNTITNSEMGIWDSNGANGNTFTGNVLSGNRIGAQVDTYGGGVAPTGLQFHSNSFIGNTVSGLINNTLVLTNALNNWWGDASGPLDDKELTPGIPNYNNPLGAGDPVSSYVDYMPWAITTFNAFSFTDKTDVALSTVIESNTITVAGIVSADVSVVGGEYSKNDGAYTSTSAPVSVGDTVKVRHTSSASYSTTVDTVLTIGGVSDTFISTTLAAPSGGGGVVGLQFLGNPTPTPTPTPTPQGEVLGEAIGNPANLSANDLKEGNLISAKSAGDKDVYGVNPFGYKRLFLSQAIFNMYGLIWGSIKDVALQVRDLFPTSMLFRNCETNDLKVYALETTGEDIAVLHWVNMTGDQAVAQDPEFFKKVFCINSNEFNWYPKSATDYTALSQLPVYVGH